MDPLAQAFMFVFGGLIGLFSKNQKDAAQAQAVKRQTDLMDLQWENTVKKANDQADKADRQSTLAEVILGNEANQALAKLGYEQEVNTLGYNQQAVALGQQQGQANAALAASGTENSSALAAAQMERDYGETVLQAQEDGDRKAADLTLAGIMGNIEESTGKLQENRTDALNLRKDYAEGGLEHQIFQKQRQNYIDNNMPDQSFGSYLNAFLSGGSTGFSTAQTISGWDQKWGAPEEGGMVAGEIYTPTSVAKLLGSNAVDAVKESSWYKSTDTFRKKIKWS